MSTACKNIYDMLEGPLAYGKRQRVVASNFTRRRAASIGLAAAVGLAYFLAALLSYGLSLTSEGLAVFWPASGVCPLWGLDLGDALWATE